MDDNKIIQLYWDRDADAINITSQKYGKYCTSIAKNILKNNEDAEECINDTYLKAWNSMPKNWPQRLGVYLGTITRNISFNKYRQKYAEKRGCGEISLVLNEIEEIVSGTEWVDKQAEEKELLWAINDFLCQLSTDKRNQFVRRYWYSKPIAEIAENYNSSVGSITMSLKRTREKLKKYLLERGFDL